MNLKTLCLLVLTLSQQQVAAQAPILQDEAEVLRQQEIQWARQNPLERMEAAKDRSWGLQQVGIVAISKPGREWTPLSGGLGLGTVQSGVGIVLDFGGRTGGWEAGAKALILDTTLGHREGRLYTGFLSYQNRSGWRFALENSPMKWGYGPLGGHLLGMSSTPFPKIRITTRTYSPTMANHSLGHWTFEWFTGQMEHQRAVPEWQASYSALENRFKAGNGDLDRPYQSGWRISGVFDDWVQINLGVTSMWGGLRPDGTDRMKGLSWQNYVMGSLGGENMLVAETSSDSVADLKHYHSLSNGIGSFDIRLRNDWLGRLFHAEGAYWYYERSGENINWQWKPFLRNPFRAFFHDLERPRSAYGNGYPDSAPAFSSPTHALGLQVHWPSVQMGLEFRDSQTDQTEPFGYETYQSGTFLSGHSREGDSLGVLFGGSYRTGSLAVDWQPDLKTKVHALIAHASRRFIDDPVLWAEDHPGQYPQMNRINYVEGSFSRAIGDGWRVGGTIGFKVESHPQYASGTRSGHTFLLALGKQLKF